MLYPVEFPVRSLGNSEALLFIYKARDWWEEGFAQPL